VPGHQRPPVGGLTYAEPGATSGWPLPRGYRHMQRSRVIGRGGDGFARAAELLMTWQMHRRAGLAVAASAPRADVGTDVTLTWKAGLLHVSAPCRVVRVTDEPDAAGFAYGTLPGHPEQGEEAFTVRLARNCDVTLDIVAFSRPARWYSRLAIPAARLVQRRITDRYLSALLSAEDN
jgi:uncharacterized protein (UPF0548 family)